MAKLTLRVRSIWLQSPGEFTSLALEGDLLSFGEPSEKGRQEVIFAEAARMWASVYFNSFILFMIKRLLHRKDILYNTSHVFLNKGLNAIVPLLLLPYFNKVFGVESYGLLIYIQSLMTLLMYVTEYGFHVTGTRDVSIHQHDHNYLSGAVSSIMVVKFILASCCYLLLLGYLGYTQVSWNQGLLYVFTFTGFVFQSFTPYWFFQGIKSNWIITTVNLVSKSVLLVLVFGFIKEGSSLVSVPIAEAVCYALSFALSIFIIFSFLKIRFSWPDWKLISDQLRSGRYIFFFSLSNWTITGGAIVAVEYYLTSTDLGYFGTFSRLMYYAFALVLPINQALFPYISGKAHSPLKDRLRFVQEIFRVYGIVVILFLAGVYFLADPFFTLFFDEKFTEGLEPFVQVFYLLSVWVAMVMVNYFIGLQVLVAFGKDKVYSKYYFINALIALAGFVIFIPNIGLIGAPFALILGEAILFLFLYSTYRNLRSPVLDDSVG